MLHFVDFQFEPSQKILYKNKEIVTLTANQAKLLALFLAEPNKIFSKNEILQQVWSDRVVSEQVVFQNISQLRSIFSDDAIKTFPKRGYQWQLTIHEPQAENITNAVVEEVVNSKEHNNAKPDHNKKWYLGLILSFLVLSLLGYFSYQQRQPSLITEQMEQITGTKVTLIPFSTRYEGNLTKEIIDHNTRTAQQLNANSIATNEQTNKIDVWSFINSPDMVRKQLVRNDELVLSGLILKRKHQDTKSNSTQYLLEFILQGQYRNWQGYLLANSVAQLTEKLVEQVHLLSQSQYFSLAIDAFTTAELSLLHSQQPENLDILKHLIERLLEEDNFDVASAQIEQMLALSKTQQHLTYTAYAKWLKGKLLIGHEQWHMAQNILEQASSLMAKADMLALQSEVNKSLADVAAHNKDFKQIKEYLYQSASQARLAKRPVQEIRAYTLLSIMSAKLQLHQQKYDYLYKAKTLLGDYQLDGSHYMLIFYHFALFAKTDEEREKFYLRIIEQPITQKNRWVFYNGVEQLSNMYIKQKKWQLALELSNSFDEIARSSALKAELYKAQQQLTKAREFAKTAFNSARTQRIDWLGSDMALMLLELSNEDSDDTDSLLYKRYIRREASSWWFNQHRKRLEKVGILLDPYNESI